MTPAHIARARTTEQRSLRFGVGANAVMAMAGFAAHVASGSLRSFSMGCTPPFWWDRR